MPGVTDPAEEYFKDGVWAWVSNQWKKLVADASNFLQINIAAQDIDVEIKQKTAADLTPGVCGWDGSAWRKLNLLWGYNDRYVEVLSELNVAAGTQSLTFTAVPAGEVWVINGVSAFCSTANPANILIRLYMAGLSVYLYAQTTVVAWQIEIVLGDFVLKEGDYVRVIFTTCALNDNIYAQAFGYKMKVAE